MRLSSLPPDFWAFHEAEKTQHFSFVPVFQNRTIQTILARDDATPPDSLDLFGVFYITCLSASQGLHLQSKFHFLRFLPLLMRLETHPAVHNHLIALIIHEWRLFLLLQSLD